MDDIIASISTPMGRGAISIIRMSGKGCLGLAKQLFSAKNLNFDSIYARMLYLGSFSLEKDSKERCLMVFFKEPNSYTGEDLVEFQIHGGSLITQKVLDRLLKAGARLAEPGEFSKRAFENGHISLDEAESIIEEINAESEIELRAALNGAGGKIKEKITAMQDTLTECIAEIEATLDYPEEDFEKDTKEKIFSKINEIGRQIDELLIRSEDAKFINKGINIAIVGAPNVGKSSLLNALVGEDSAIVTEIAGTTRDTKSEQIFYKGVKLNFIDTAGIRDTKDVVEKIGVEKSLESVTKADIVLLVLDGSRILRQEDKEIFDMVQNRNFFVIINKGDLPRKCEKFGQEIVISAKNQENVEEIKKTIHKKLINEEMDFSSAVITNERQIELLRACKKILSEIQCAEGQSMDIYALLYKKLWNELGKITGQCENEEIVDMIFAKFCLGK